MEATFQTVSLHILYAIGALNYDCYISHLLKGITAPALTIKIKLLLQNCATQVFMNILSAKSITWTLLFAFCFSSMEVYDGTKSQQFEMRGRSFPEREISESTWWN